MVVALSGAATLHWSRVPCSQGPCVILSTERGICWLGLKVWNALTRIPYGETRSYREIAREIGHPDAVRAVGAANGANPVAIIVPCHRVIGSNGSLTGYGGGLPTKAWLLALEQ